MSTVARVFWNPIVAKEYRSRMRTWRSPVTMTVFIVLVGGLGWAIFSAMANAPRYVGSSPTQYGPQLFMWLVIFEVVLLSFITPPLTPGAISGRGRPPTNDRPLLT